MLGLRRDSRTHSRSGVLGHLTSHYGRPLALAAAAFFLCLVAAPVVLPLSKPFSGAGGFFDNLDHSLAAGVALAGAAYFWFYFWTSHSVTRNLFQVAQRTPELMFPHSPEAGAAERVFGRDDLVEEIATDLNSKLGSGPQIVVGDTGSGKTTLLLALAQHLARDHRILPIVLSLRDSENDLERNDFSELAAKRFGELVDPYIKTTAEGEKLWRWMCGRKRIAVLADDLDRSTQAGAAYPYKAQIRLALDAARRRKLPLVLTTRPAGLPPDLGEQPIDLSDRPLENQADAPGFVLGQAGREDRDDEARTLVEKNIEAGKLLENAFYLNLLTGLLRADLLDEPPEGGKHAVRVALLEAERERLCGADVVEEEEYKRQEEAMRRVERFAVAWLLPKEEPGFESCWVDAIRDGERFGLLALDDDRHPQFKHEVLHAYLASRAIARGDPSWKRALDDRPNGARVQLALILAAAARGEPHCRDALRRETFCAEACERLLAETPGATADLRLLRASAAAEIGRAGSFPDLDSKIAERCDRARADAGPVAKRAALEQLEALGGDAAVKTLWVYAHDEDYGTRWAAVRRLVGRCSGGTTLDGESIRPPFGPAAYEIVDPEIEKGLRDGHELLRLGEEERPDDWHPKIVLLKQIAWMLPSLRTGAEDCLRDRLDTHLKELLYLERERVTLQRGLEASVAQGFKADANLHPGKSPDRDAVKMLRTRAVFWYSQINLIHALALRMAEDPDSDAGSLKSIVASVGERERMERRGFANGATVRGDLHPMAKVAAELCVKALKGDPGEERLERVRRQVWDDEGIVVSGRPGELDRAAAQLVGEMTLLLDLNETGSPAQRQAFGENPTLPHCLSRSRDRREMRTRCHTDCRFDLCPYRPARDKPSAHRELSGAFCRDQRRRASRWTAWRWGSRVHGRGLRELWRWLEAQARF